MSECVERGVGTIAVGNLKGVREDDKTCEVRNWGDRGNEGLHGWAFDRFTNSLTYKVKVEGIAVAVVSERDTSKTCSSCGEKREAHRVERGLYVCHGCGTVMNADSNGAENIRCRLDQAEKVTLNPRSSGDRSSGRVARLAVNLFRRGEYDPSSGQGRSLNRRATANHKYPNCGREASPFTARRMSLVANVVERAVQLKEFSDNVTVRNSIPTRRRVRDFLDEFNLK